LTRDQARTLLEKAEGEDIRSLRDLAMFSVLLGCGLRRAELSALKVDDLHIRQGHWAIVDLVGKGGHIRTVPMPLWVKAAIDRWISAASIKTGRVFRAISRHGTPWGKGISENVIWYVVRRCAERMQLDHLAPHDLRRTCAKPCHADGGELEQIQFLLGHVSVLTTERYLGCKQNLEEPVNDRFGCLFSTNLVDICEEDVPVGCFRNGHGGLETTRGQRRNHGEDFPVTLRRRFTDTLATRSASTGAGHLRCRPAFVQENQPFDRYCGDLFPPRLPTLLRLFAVLFLGMERLFFCGKPNWRTTTIQSQPTLKCRRCACSSRSCSSARVTSGLRGHAQRVERDSAC